jgi:hypothetical protein
MMSLFVMQNITRGHKKITSKRPPIDMPNTRATRSKKNMAVQHDDASNGFSISTAAPSSQVEEISANFNDHNLTQG